MLIWKHGIDICEYTFYSCDNSYYLLNQNTTKGAYGPFRAVSFLLDEGGIM